MSQKPGKLDAKHRHGMQEARRAKVAEMYLACIPQVDIAKALDVSIQTILIDIKEMRQEWRDSRQEFAESAFTEQLVRIDRVEREAWAAWERSQKPAKATIETSSDEKSETREESREQYGDPQLLNTALKAIEHRRKLLGLDAPVKSETKNETTITAPLQSREAMAEEIRKLVAKRSQPQDAPPRK
jgi:hypothetical protein